MTDDKKTPKTVTEDDWVEEWAAQKEENLQAAAAESPTLKELLGKRARVQKLPLKKRPWQISFGPTLIPAGETINVRAQPKVLFRGEKLIANASGATRLADGVLTYPEDDRAFDDLHLDSFFVARMNDLPGGESISFRKLRTGLEWKMRTIDRALVYTAIITNWGSRPYMADLLLYGIVAL